MKPVVALISPNKDAYSETFIQAHRNIPDCTIKYYFGNLLPTELDGFGRLSKSTRIERYLRHFTKKIIKSNLSGQEHDLARSFKKEKIQCVLAEYGVTGAHVLNVCKKLKLPLIVHFHGFDISMKDVLRDYQNQYQRMFDYAYAIVGVSRLMIERLEEFGCNKNKLYYNPCAPSDSFNKIECRRDKMQFLSVGRFVDKKAPYLTILAFRKVLEVHKDVKLVMCGEGPLLETCQNLVEFYGIENKVEFKGKVNKDAIIKLLQESIAFVQHSITSKNGDMEGTPVGVMEASSAGLPVVSTNHAGIPDVIQNGKTGYLVSEKDVDNMALYMRKVLENSDLAKQMGEYGKVFIKENITMRNHLNLLRKLVYNSVKPN